jgi:hypothetical protein
LGWCSLAQAEEPQRSENSEQPADEFPLLGGPFLSLDGNARDAERSPSRLLGPWIEQLRGPMVIPLDQSAKIGPGDSLLTGKTGWNAGTSEERWVPEAEFRNGESYQLPLAGPVYLFGQVKSGTGVGISSDSKVVGGTGLGCKVPINAGAELLVGCGSELTYLGSVRGSRLSEQAALPLQSQLLRLDVQCRYPLWAGVGLEYQGTAFPALNAWDREQLNQDVRVVCPVGKGGQLRLGAKHSWEASAEPKPGAEALQLYGGFRLGW